MPSKYPKGSEWRRWDLHIHTPASTLHNEFNGWESYLDAIEAADPAICAVGITDYASLDGYKRIRNEIDAKSRLANISLVLPNIEFRVSPFTKQGSAINLHVLVDPREADHIQRIEDALNRLTFTYQGQKYPCNQAGLRDLGKAFDGSIKDGDAAYREGVKQFKPDFEVFREWYDSEKWLKRNSLIVVSNSSNDGASGLKHDDGYKAKRQEIYRFSNAVFSGNPKDREYFCGKGPDSEEQLAQTVNGRKPCVHGSDAHKEERLFRPDEERFCWIKADPTFEGLRQILYEPEARVHIGKTYPEARDENRIISSVRFIGTNGWFHDIELPINPALVNIIGSKGSGKTALVDLVAYATGSWTSNTNSFLYKAHRELEGSEVVVTWSGGGKDAVVVPKRLEDGRDQKVRYLSQQFVEHLCSEDKVGTELVHEIEQVIFEYLDDTEKLGETSFSGLRIAKTGSVRNQQVRLRSSIAKLNQDIDELRLEIDSRHQKAERVAELENERKGLEKQKPAFDSEEEQKIEDELSVLRDTRQKLVDKISAQKQQLERIAEVRDRVASFEDDMKGFFNELMAELRDLGVEREELENFHPSFRGDVRKPLDKKEKQIRTEIDTETGSDGDKYPDKGTLCAVDHRIGELEKLSFVDQAKKQRNIEIQKRVAAIDAEIAKLRKAIKSIDSTRKTELATKIEERWDKYLWTSPEFMDTGSSNLIHRLELGR
jgi:predicted  nucleic acid-binding Zn-ribbon protein